MNLREAIMRSQDVDAAQADDIIDELKQQVLEGADPEEVLFNEGLEPDYVFDLLD